MAEVIVDRSMAGVCSNLCSTLGSDTYLVNPSRAFLTALVDWGVGHPSSFVEMRVLAEEWTLKGALNDFTVASRAADLIERDLLTIRYLPDPPKSTVAVDGECVIVVIDAEEIVGSLSTTEGDFARSFHGACSSQFDRAEPYTIHTPPISLIETTLEDRLGSGRRDDFVKLVAAAERDGAIDEVMISLLVAAKHRDLLYDVSKWGEDIGLASKATFSRKKTELEEHALIETESEPIDVGRPRLRLRLAEPALEEATAAEIIQETNRQLA